MTKCRYCDREARCRRMCFKHYQRWAALKKPKKLCACGCGILVRGTFKSGHNTKLLSSAEQKRRGDMNDGSAKRDKGKSDWYRKIKGRHEHRIVMELQLGRKLLSSEIVHHINGNKKDNRPINLQLVSRSAHWHLHREDIFRGRKS